MKPGHEERRKIIREWMAFPKEQATNQVIRSPRRQLKQAEQVVERTVDQTRGALDNYFSFMQKAFSFYPVDGTELGEKMNRYTAQNISAAQDFVHKLSQAKDLQDIIRIQTEFMQTQFSVLAEQTKSLTEAFTNVPISTMSRSVSRRPSAA